MLQQSALAAAGATEDNEHFARVDFEVNMSQDDLPVVGGGEIFHPDDRLALRTHRHSNSKVVVDHRKDAIGNGNQNDAAHHGARRRFPNRGRTGFCL